MGLVVLGACGSEESSKRCSEDPSECFTPPPEIERPTPNLEPQQVSCDAVCSRIYGSCGTWLVSHGYELSFRNCLAACDRWGAGVSACFASMRCDSLSYCSHASSCVFACYNLRQCGIDGLDGARTGSRDLDACVDDCEENHPDSASCVAYVRDCAEDEFALCGVGE